MMLRPFRNSSRPEGQVERCHPEERSDPSKNFRGERRRISFFVRLGPFKWENEILRFARNDTLSVIPSRTSTRNPLGA